MMRSRLSRLRKNYFQVPGKWSSTAERDQGETTGCSKRPPATLERAKAPERTPVREKAVATENAAGDLFQHPIRLALAVLTALGVLTFSSAVIEAFHFQPAILEVGGMDDETVPILNHSFEDPPLAENNFTSTFCNPGDPICVQTATPVIGWQIVGSAGTWNPTATAYPDGVPEGVNIAYANSGSDAFISQTLDAVLEPNRSYILEVDIGRRADDQFPGYKVQLWAGETLLAEDDNSLTPDPGTFATSKIAANIGATHPALGESLEIVLISQGRQTNFDDVKLTVKPFGAAINIPFYVKLDGTSWTLVAKNGSLELVAHCTVNGSGSTMRLFLTSTRPGWFASNTLPPLAAGFEVDVVLFGDDESAFFNATDGLIAAAPDGATLGVIREGTGVGVNIFDHDCVAIGTAVLINDSN